MAPETLLVLVAVGAFAGWLLLGYAEDDNLQNGDDLETVRHGEAGNDRYLHGLAALGLTRETCVWIHETMTQSHRAGIEDRAAL